MVFQIVIKNNAMKNFKDMNIRDQELLNNLLYNTSVVNPVIHKKNKMKIKVIILLEITTVIGIVKTTTPTTMTDIEITTDTEATVEIIHKIFINLILDKDITIDLKTHTNLGPDMKIIIKEELHPDLHIDHHTETTPIIDTILDQDTDLVLIHKETPLDDTITRIGLHPDQEITDSPSQNRQQNRINQVVVKSTNYKDSTKFEIHTCQITEIANTITPYSWFYPLYLHASEGKDNILPSILEILFLLDAGASISVLNLPTIHVIAKQINLNVPKMLKKAKTLTVANQTEVPIIHYVSMTCFTEVNHQNRSFNIEFAVANIKYNILGTPFFKKHIQNKDFQRNIMTCKEQHPKLPTKTHFSTFTEEDYPYVSYINTIESKEPIHFKPRSGKTINFPINNYLNLHFKLEDNTKIYPSIPYTYFLQKFEDVFHFLDLIVKDKSKDSCSTVIQNFTSHRATLPRGIIGYKEIPFTQTTPPHYSS